MSDFDLPTRSASGFLLRYIAPRVEPFQLFSFLARRLPFQLSAPQSDIIIGAGHGSKTSFTGQNESVIKLLSCQTGVSLGPDLIKNGAEAFLGYKDDYVWVMDSDLASTPWADEMASTCLLPVVDGLNALLDGKTAKEAFEVELQGYTRNAAAEEDALIKSCLGFNYDNAVLLGEPTARVRSRPNIKILLPPPPIFLPIS
jgi:hypothetical protein